MSYLMDVFIHLYDLLVYVPMYQPKSMTLFQDISFEPNE